MNRETRDKFATRTQDDLTTGNACWETPPDVYRAIWAQFGPFDLDLTADPVRHLEPRWFGPGSPLLTDALDGDWPTYGNSGFSNPPYGPFVQQILARADYFARHARFQSTFLLPMRVTKAWHAHVMHGASEVWLCDSRITFWENGAPRIDPTTKQNIKLAAKGLPMQPNTAMFDSVIVRYDGRWTTPRFGTFKVPR